MTDDTTIQIAASTMPEATAVVASVAPESSGNVRAELKDAFQRLRADLAVLEKLLLASSPATPITNASDGALSDEERTLESQLKQLRLQLAKERGINYLPAVYDNRMLRQLIRQKPRSIEELRQVQGFGTKRLELYGSRILQALEGSVCPGQGKS